MHERRVIDRLAVALDVSNFERAAELVAALGQHVGWFKIGSVLFTREGPRICRLVTDSGARLFLDLKFHDIPNTVAGAVGAAIDTGCEMMTVHTSGGEAMLRAAVEARESARSDVMLVGVTVLTHLTFEDFNSVFASNRSTEDTVISLATTAKTAGLDGVVASARELKLLKRKFGDDLKVITPGIRLTDGSKDDQTRVVTPGRAVSDGADYIVVGRPIIAAPDPVAACKRILTDMAGQ